MAADGDEIAPRLEPAVIEGDVSGVVFEERRVAEEGGGHPAQGGAVAVNRDQVFAAELLKTRASQRRVAEGKGAARGFGFGAVALHDDGEEEVDPVPVGPEEGGRPDAGILMEIRKSVETAGGRADEDRAVVLGGKRVRVEIRDVMARGNDFEVRDEDGKGVFEVFLIVQEGKVRIVDVITVLHPHPETDLARKIDPFLQRRPEAPDVLGISALQGVVCVRALDLRPSPLFAEPHQGRALIGAQA